MFSGKNIVWFLGVSSLVFGSVLTGSNTTFANSVNSGIDSVEKGQILSKERNGFIFKLKGCTKKTSQLFVCNFETKNLQNKRRKLYISRGKSRLFDSTGNEIYAHRVRLGQSSSTVFPSNIVINGYITTKVLPKGDLVLIELAFESEGEQFRVEFRPQ